MISKHFDRAQILFDQQRYELAEKELRAAIAENPESADAHALLAACLMNQKCQRRPKTLIESVQEAIDGHQSVPEALNLLEFALSRDSENGWYHYLLAFYWYGCGNLERARHQIEIAISIEPDAANYHYTLACILFDRGKLQVAGFSSASRGFAEFFKSYLFRYYLKPVIAPLQKSLALDPNDLSALNLLTDLYITMGQYREALFSSQTALSRDPDNAHAHDLHGQILIGCDRYTEAIEHFQTALRIAPNFDRARSNLLEAMRSQYWIYPWISFDRWRGKMLLVLLLLGVFILPPVIRYLLTGSVNIQTPWERLVFVPFLFAVINIPASRWSFNYFLSKSPQAKFLLTDRDVIYARFALAASIFLMVFTNAALALSKMPIWFPVMNLIIISSGILTVPFVFGAVREVKFPILKTVYPIVVGLLGLACLFLYLQGQEILLMMGLFMFLALITPVVAICNCQTIE
jgi:tetratricopeptide (TPR) repeat protein